MEGTSTKQPSAQQRLDELNTKFNSLTEWEQGFYESVKTHFRRRGSLSPSQTKALDRMIERHSDRAVEAREKWIDKYDDEKRGIAKIVSEYYVNTPYYQKVARRILDEPDFIPNEKTYRKMTENKYAQQALKRNYEVPLFGVGQLVRFRRIDENRMYGKGLAGKLGVVITIGGHQGCAKGCRAYSVLPCGASKAVMTQERWIMQCKAINKK